MGEVIDLAQHKADQQPHVAGPARCITCEHTWTAVAPTGTVWLECPACATVKGVFVHHVEMSSLPVLHCACGNYLLMVYTDRYLCPHCGEALPKD